MGLSKRALTVGRSLLSRRQISVSRNRMMRVLAFFIAISMFAWPAENRTAQARKAVHRTTPRIFTPMVGAPRS